MIVQAEQLFPDITCPLPAWLPEKWHEPLAGSHEQIAFSGGELDALRRVAYRPMSEWADEGGYVAIGAHGGDWSGEVTPHAAKIMDTWWQPTTREVVFCSIEQDGKTAVMYNCIGGSQDMAPGPAMLIMPTEKKAGDVATERLHPMFRNSRLLKRLVSGRADDLTKTMIRLNNGARIFMAWANSADALSSWPIKYLFFDETDKYPEFVGKEANPITLGEKRVRNFEFDYKIFKSSTPSRESGYIHKELESCPQIWEWHLRCTHCGDTFRAGADHLVIPKDATLDTLLPGSVYLSCPHCNNVMTESERRFATRMGKWVCRKGADLVDPEKVGFHRRAYDCKDISLYKIAIAKLKADSGDLESKIAWANGFEAINYKEDRVDRKEDTILRLRDLRPVGVVPMAADAIEISIDTQDKGFWYRIRAWQYGLALTSWLIKSGYVTSATPDDFSALDTILAAEYPDENGEPHRIMAGIIDSAGHRTAEVYAWSRRTGVLAAMGAPGRKTQPVTVSRLDRFPGNNRPIPGGLALYRIDTHYHKDLLANKLIIDPTDPGALVLHSGYTWDQLQAIERDPAEKAKTSHNLEDYARQMCAESRDDRNLWQCPPNKANHLWDCESNGIALVMWLGWQHAVSEKIEQTAVNQTSTHQASGGSLPGWFNNR